MPGKSSTTWEWQRPPQLRLRFNDELIVDNFAGGGGASMGLEKAIGRSVDIAINHDPKALAMHKVNHPGTRHICEDVFNVDPEEVCDSKPVGLAWFSPDCKHFSKAKGGKPVEKKIRGLAWVAIRWASKVKPRIIILENVEEFEHWGPLNSLNMPCPARKGDTFKQFVNELEKLGYKVEWRLLRACDFGAPTIRRRLFLIARCDAQPIVWPRPTHGKGLQPYATAADCIDWSIPLTSIFGRKRPLVDATMRRIARGIKRFVLDAKEPFIVTCNHGGDRFRGQGLDKPLVTVTAAHDAHGLVVPYFVPRHGEHPKQKPRCRAANLPLPTITTTQNGATLVAAFIAKHYGGTRQTSGSSMKDPMSTVTTVDHNALVACNIVRSFGQSVGSAMDKPIGSVTAGGGGKSSLLAAHLLSLKGNSRRMMPLSEPGPTICAGGNHAALVAALMAPYYGSGSGTTGRDLREPAPTITTKDRLQLVTVTIDQESYILVDIGMRMLQPRELYRAQGFPDDYVIDLLYEGKPLSKADQVRMCGNSVPPPFAHQIALANYVNVSSQPMEVSHAR